MGAPVSDETGLIGRVPVRTVLIRLAAVVAVVGCCSITAILASLDPTLGRYGVAGWACVGPLSGLIIGLLNRIGRSQEADPLMWVVGSSAAILLIRLLVTAGAMI